MLSTLSEHIASTSHNETRILIKYNEFLREQSARTLSPQLEYDVNQQVISTGKGLRLLKLILQHFDLGVLDSLSSNYSRLTKHISPITASLAKALDKSKQGKFYKSLFFDRTNGIEVSEYMFLVADVNTIIRLPLDTTNWNIWKQIKPLRIISHDSMEYTIHLVSDTISYASYNPNYAVISLDIPALVLKYYMWTMAQDKNERNIDIFLRREILPHMLVDCTDSWLLNQLHQLMLLPEASLNTMYTADSLTVDARFSRIVPQAFNGFKEIWTLVQEIKRTANPTLFMTSQLLMSGSLHDKIIDIRANMEMPMLPRYDWLRWLRDKDLITIAIDNYLLRPKIPSTRTLITKLYRKLNTILRDKPWNECDDLYMRNKISSEIQQYAEHLDSML